MFSEKCRTNNDCGSGRCEWRRCVGKLGKVISDRMEIENCYVDDDCPIKQVCRGGSCQERLPLISDVVNVRPDHCYTDANCPLGFKCGFYKKCYNMSDGRYVVESFMHIPCKHEAPSFCAEATGFENAICREIYFEHENVRSYICQFPPPFMYAEHKSCDEKGGCSRYGTCIRGTCYQPFWVTVRQRCKSNDECTFRATCNSDGGCEEGRWALRYRTCRVSSECGNGGSGSVMRYVCRRFECTYRRSVPAECDACRFDEFCDLYENCLRVQRFSELNCDGDNWFYWYSAFYCSSTTEKTYKDALLECMELKAKLVYSPDRGSETSLSPENALLSYLAIRAGWVKEENDEIEKNFVNWNFDSEKMKKSRFFCKKEVPRSSVPNNATAYIGQKCQTSFVYRHDYCYLAGFTNFMPRFAIRTICNLMDSEIVKIKNKEEAHTVYGLAGGKSFWLGLRKGKRDWYWDTSTYGTRAHFFFWRTGQPDITDNKNCAYAAYAGEWMSADCDSFRSPKIFVCQSPSYKN
uniref:C-type lectin domain-containing protein n=1 Tax=Loa loa TaxID=7209 RepID=A0A1I7VN05_LOALO